MDPIRTDRLTTAVDNDAIESIVEVAVGDRVALKPPPDVRPQRTPVFNIDDRESLHLRPDTRGTDREAPHLRGIVDDKHLTSIGEERLVVHPRVDDERVHPFFRLRELNCG